MPLTQSFISNLLSKLIPQLFGQQGVIDYGVGVVCITPLMLNPEPFSEWNNFSRILALLYILRFMEKCMNGGWIKISPNAICFQNSVINMLVNLMVICLMNDRF